MTALSIQLVSDTGSSSTDEITSNPAVTGVGQANTAVTIQEGGTTLGTTMADSTGAWSFAPVGLADGPHTLIALQRDMAGNIGGATLISFKLDTTAPRVSMALVSDTGSSSTDEITSNPAVTGIGQANTLVTITEGNTTLGTTMADSTGAWSFAPVGLADGVHTLIASDTDVAGNIGTATLSFTLEGTALRMSMALVSDTGSSSTDKITSNPAVAGTGQANALVTITEGGTTLGTTRADSTGAWSFAPVGLADGVHTLSANQTDVAGDTETATLSFTLDTTAPRVSMALVSDTGSSSTDEITSNPAVTGIGQANTLVTITEGNTTLGTTMADSTGAWSFAPVGLADGVHTLIASDTDVAGNIGTATLSFTLEGTALRMSMALVSDTGSSSTDKITSNPAVAGTGQANALVTITEGGTTLGTTRADSTGAWSFAPVGLADGVHTLSANQTDVAGDTETATLSFTLDTTAPRVSMALVSDTGSSSTDEITSNPAVAGIGQANTLVTIREDGTILGTTTSDSTGAWTFTPTGLADGAHTLTSTETDSAGNTGSATLNFTLDSASSAFPDYQRIVIDSNPIGRDTVEKALADIQGTGKLDIVIGDALGGGLWWYKQPASGNLTDTWTKYKISSGSFYEDVAPYDVNHDGAVDLIASDISTRQVVWFENPRGEGGDPATATWNMHTIRNSPAHDIRLGDLNGDGKIDVVTSYSPNFGSTSGIAFQNGPDSWTNVPMPAIKSGIARFDSGSGKGAVDLVGADANNNVAWWENPLDHGGNPLTDQWIEHVITNIPGAAGNSFATGVFSSSGRADILTVSNENNTAEGIYRLVAPADRRTGTWTVQTVSSDYQYAHSIVTADMNNDGKLDFVTAEQEQSAKDRVSVFYNDGAGNFSQQVLANTGGQNGRVGDVNGDGTLDILNENHGFYGAPHPVELFVNQLYAG